jgi:hypothetical protein
MAKTHSSERLRLVQDLFRVVPPKSELDAPPAETVEAFLARGGQVEVLDRGVGGHPVLRTLRDIHDEAWRIAEANRQHKPAAQVTPTSGSQ